MTNPREADQEAIRKVVGWINEYWRGGRYDRIGELLADEAVIAPPGFGGRVRGRAPYVQSYRDYDRAAKTLEFHAPDPEIDVVGDVAVAVCPFEVVYEMRDAIHRERGHDIVVLARIEREWKVAWRTMQVSPVEDAG